MYNISGSHVRSEGHVPKFNHMLLASFSILVIRLACAATYNIPLQNVSLLLVLSSQTSIIVLPSNVAIFETNGLSTWDVQWINWPSIAGQGAWQWYCPDTYCNSNGPGWVQFATLPTTITNV